MPEGQVKGSEDGVTDNTPNTETPFTTTQNFFAPLPEDEIVRGLFFASCTPAPPEPEQDPRPALVPEAKAGEAEVDDAATKADE